VTWDISVLSSPQLAQMVLGDHLAQQSVEGLRWESTSNGNPSFVLRER